MKKMTKKRKAALRHARGIVKRLEKAGYAIAEEYYESLKEFSTRKLQLITRKGLLQKGIATVVEDDEDDDWYDDVIDSSETEYEMIMNVIQEGMNYSGQYSKKQNGWNAKEAVQASGDRLNYILESAVENGKKLGLSETEAKKQVVAALKELYGSVDKIIDMISDLVYAVYDDVYAEWAQGIDAYEAELERMVGAINAEDMGFI